MTETIWLALITMIGASIANITASVMAYLKSRDAAKSAVKAVDGTTENRNAIQEIHVAVNDRLTQLLEAKDLQHVAQANAAHVAGRLEQQQIDYNRIKDNDFVQTKDQFELVWNYLRHRAITEINAQGFLTSDNSLTPEIRQWYKPITNRLRNWYNQHKDLDDLQLFFACHKEFGDELLNKICKPYNVLAGSCIEMAVMIAKENGSRGEKEKQT